MSTPKYLRFDTLSLHAGQVPDPQFGARATPIYQTASYVFKDTDHAASLFNMERGGHVYSRISNPTNAVLEERIAALEGGVGAIAVASGQAAMHLAVSTLLGAGAHVVASHSLYGGSHNLLAYTLPRFGVETTFVSPRDLDGWRAAIRPEHPAPVRRDARQPGPRRARRPRGRGDRARGEATAPRRRDVHDAVPDAPVRPRRGPPLPLRDQVPERPRHRDRRAAGRLGEVRLGRLRQVPDADRALRGVPRHGFHRGVDRRRVPAAGAPRGAARLRRLHEPDDRVPHPAGHRDAAAADAAPRREHAPGRRVPRAARRSRIGRLPGTASPIPTTRSRSGSCRTAAARCSASRSRAAGRGAELHRGACGCSRTSRTSATRNRW